MAGARRARGLTSAADALTPVWRSQVSHLRSSEAEVQAQGPDAVHRFRVAARRLRSNLSAFQPLLDRTVTSGLTAGLRRTATEVGGTRDVEMLRERIEQLSIEVGDPATATTVDLLRRSIDSAPAASWEHARDHLDSEEYDRLTRALEAFSDLPPWLPAAASPAGEVLTPILDAEWSRLSHQARAALDPNAPAAQVLHTRRAARRTRHVAEALVPPLGKKARRVARAAEQVQETLGEYQDCLVVQTFLDEVRREGRIGENQLGRDELRVLARMRGLEASTAVARHAGFVQVFIAADRKVRRTGRS